MTTNTLAYGFVDLETLAAERVTTVGERRIFDAIQATLTEYNRGVNGLMASMVQRTTEHKIRYILPGTGTLQPLDAAGVPIPVKEEGYYDVAFPIQGGGTAWGADRVARAMATVEEINRHTVNSMLRDGDWLRRHILAALFDNVSWTFADPVYGDLTIEPLANTDSVTYLKTGGTVAADEHYLYQSAAISDSADPFDDIYTELMEHPSNSGPVVVYIPTALVATATALTAFTEVGDPDIIKGDSADQIGRVLDRGLGDEVLGKVDKCWLVEWRALPSTHMIAHAQGAGPVLRMREYEAPALQGFFSEGFSPDGARQETRMIRYAGFGVVNRVAAAVCYVGGGSYSIPSGYDAPQSS